MTKYFLQFLLPLFGYGVQSSPEPTKPLTAENVTRVQRVLAYRAAQRAAQNEVVRHEDAIRESLEQKVQQAQQSKPKTVAIVKKVVDKKTTTAEPSVQVILTHMEEYVDCATACIKGFLSANDKRKLNCFAQEIDRCVHKFDAQVIKPLESMKQDPLGANLYQLAMVLRNNQVKFKGKLVGGYKNAMSLGMALLGLKNQAIQDVNKTLDKVSPIINKTYATQFAPIKNKIIHLTTYDVNPMKAIGILGNRF